MIRAATFYRLELVESLRSRWLSITAAIYALVVFAFIWLGMRESSVLGFTGLSRVVLHVATAIVVALPLLVLVSTSSIIVRARTSGLFELLLAQPCRRNDWFAGMLGARLTTLLGPLVGVFLAIGLATVFLGGEGEFSLVSTIVRCLAVSAALLWAFLGIGLLISATARTAERALAISLLVWISCSALHDFALMGLLLHTRLPPSTVFTLAALNPIEAARVGILTSVDPELSVLGPVGFWLANHLGAGKALFIAIAWPFTLGTMSMMWASRKLRRSDLVA